MPIIMGLTDDQLLIEADQFADVVIKGLEETMQKTLQSIDNIVAATEPPPGDVSTATKVITAATLSYITYYWGKFTTDVLSGLITAMLDAGAIAITEAVMRALPSFKATPFNTLKNAFTKQVLNAALGRLRNLGDELLQHAREQYAIGRREQDTLKELTTRLMKAASLLEKRADSVSRTEVVSAFNTAGLIQIQELGGKGRKTWMAKLDTRTRDTHRHADNQTVRINQKFHVGITYLDVPGDASAAVDETINCRCTVTYDIDYFELENSTLRHKG